MYPKKGSVSESLELRRDKPALFRDNEKFNLVASLCNSKQKPQNDIQDLEADLFILMYTDRDHSRI